MCASCIVLLLLFSVILTISCVSAQKTVIHASLWSSTMYHTCPEKVVNMVQKLVTLPARAKVPLLNRIIAAIGRLERHTMEHTMEFKSTQCHVETKKKKGKHVPWMAGQYGQSFLHVSGSAQDFCFL